MGALRPVEGQAGAAFAIGGRLAGVEWFDAPATLHELLPKIVGSYALDAAFTTTAQPAMEAPSLDAVTVRAWIARLSTHQPQVHETVGLGEALRWESRHMTAAALTLDTRVIHFVGFPLEDERRPSGRMRSASQRRRQHRTE